MTVSEVIKGLQKVLDEHGDIECYYSTDEEGNGYHRVSYESSVLFKYMGEDDYYEDLYSQVDMEDMAEDDDEFDPKDYAVVCCIN